MPLIPWPCAPLAPAALRRRERSKGRRRSTRRQSPQRSTPPRHRRHRPPPQAPKRRRWLRPHCAATPMGQWRRVAAAQFRALFAPPFGRLAAAAGRRFCRKRRHDHLLKQKKPIRAHTGGRREKERKNGPRGKMVQKSFRKTFLIA